MTNFSHFKTFLILILFWYSPKASPELCLISSSHGDPWLFFVVQVHIKVLDDETMDKEIRGNQTALSNLSIRHTDFIPKSITNNAVYPWLIGKSVFHNA